MKVYKTYIPSKRDYKKVPQIKIANSWLIKAGFYIGAQYKILYQPNKIILEVVSSETN